MAPDPCIVVAIDLSEASKPAWLRAKDLATRLQARVVLVHAFSPPRGHRMPAKIAEGPHVPTLTAAADLQLHEAHDLTERWAQPLRDAGIDATVMARPGMVSEAILAAAATHEPEFIIMGRQGQGRFRRAILGSQTRYVSEHSKWPVLIVPS